MARQDAVKPLRSTRRTVQIQARVRPEFKVRLREEAARRLLDESDIIRQAVEYYLARDDPAARP